MKERELREAANCGVCNKKIGESNLPMFMRVRVQRHALKVEAIRRQQGLGMMLGGNGLLASVMGPNEEMTEVFHECEITVCDLCTVEHPLLMRVLESAEDEDEE